MNDIVYVIVIIIALIWTIYFIKKMREVMSIE